MRWVHRLLFFGLLTAPAAFADPPPTDTTAAEIDQNDDLAAILMGLQEAYRDINALQARFVQVTRSVSFGDGPTQPGTITIARPRMMRVDFDGPQAAQFISDGQTLWVYTPANKQVIVTPDLSEESDGLSDLLTSLTALQERFAVSLVSQTEADTVISLKPKTEAQFQEILLTVSRTEYQLKRLEMRDLFDAVTEMRFETVVTNPTLGEGVFSFTPPQGIQVVQTDQL